jgi:magnesium-transporting ATPase (P-type)
MRKKARQVAEIPFSSENKLATIHEPVKEINGIDGDCNQGEYVVHVKGAPDRMIALCSHQAKGGVIGADMMEPFDMQYWTDQISILSSYDLRCLALCRALDSVEKGQPLNADFINGKALWLAIVVLCGFMDHPRPECVDAIKTAHMAGIRVAMITGDPLERCLALLMANSTKLRLDLNLITWT